MNNLKNTSTVNIIPHRENNDLMPNINWWGSTSPTHVDYEESPRNIAQVPPNSDPNILAPSKLIRQIHDIYWCYALVKEYGKEFILVQNTMRGNMQLHFIVREQESPKYKKWYLNIPKEKPIVDDMKFSRKNKNDLWEYLKEVRIEWIPYNGGEFSNKEIDDVKKNIASL
jgi:hypothetical protein